METLWDGILSHLKGRLSRPTFETWIKPATAQQFEQDCLIIRTPNPFARSWLQQHYAGAIAQAGEQVIGRPIQVDFIVSEQSEEALKPVIEREPAPAAPPANVASLNSKYTFSRFVVGANNRMAHVAALAVAEMPGCNYNPLFLCGGVGLGKTHLMQAIGHYRLDIDTRTKIAYVSTERFANELIEAIRRDAMQTFREHYRRVDLLMIDDIQFIEGKEYTQEEFFHTFNALYESGKQIVIASDRPPQLIPRLQERLSSRFSMGLITDIQQPDIETRMAILQKKAEYENMFVPQDVIHHIASAYTTNIRELEGALIRAVAYVSISGLPMTVETISPILSPPRTRGEITDEAILELVCDELKVSAEDMRSDSRRRDISQARQLCMYLLRKYTDLSLPKIGQALGGKDHTTVLYAIDKIEQSKIRDPEVQRLLQRLGNRLEADARH
ncbi:chromosomal replication initiator protein DnaA [Gloeobacter violaceus]|uniref:Chromosomal replication initiator protein DnaA n=1 Tax=Gloeobacter violaceus (strain ATCC 29082 / PCC 7421) TaxID=251221 RepID=DNAA_GLOVI|nr:chromosomal replication initiator protein DnaA [Gloeobacter violaceus]Q7NKK4.1 RecName: Full=Chromosomal replication initiator protein DnaA [Gloeobacter violaceus PCC 7421]BAC89414.1 chromosomal replication initiator protein [Gloeobacter violaceus PCC 7421]